MSYILDALRQADAERERGAVPGLHARHEPRVGDDVEEAAPRRTLVVASAAVLGTLVVGALAWLALRDDEPPRTIAAATPSTVAPSPIGVALPTSPAVVATGGDVGEAGSQGGAAAVAAPPTPASSARTPERASPTPRPAAPAPIRPTASTPAPAPTIAAAPRRPAPASTDGADDKSRVYAQADLPEAVRRDLPKVSINGASYSRDKASRMVMVNGQVFHEGDTVAPGLVLESIRLKSAVLAYKGWRYELQY